MYKWQCDGAELRESRIGQLWQYYIMLSGETDPEEANSALQRVYIYANTVSHQLQGSKR